MNRNNQGCGIKVVVGDMPINTAMRKFKQKVDDAGCQSQSVFRKTHHRT